MLRLKVIVFALTVTLIKSAPLLSDGVSDQTDQVKREVSDNSKPVTIVKWIYEPYTDESRQYKYEYETSDGQGREEIGKIVKNKNGEDSLFVRGSYTFVGPDGIVYSVFYTADENGFQATGDHIPGKDQELPVVQIDGNAIISLLG